MYFYEFELNENRVEPNDEIYVGTKILLDNSGDYDGIKLTGSSSDEESQNVGQGKIRVNLPPNVFPPEEFG